MDGGTGFRGRNENMKFIIMSYNGQENVEGRDPLSRFQIPVRYYRLSFRNVE